MYKVEYWSQDDQGWIKSSTHRNLDYAEVNVDVLLQGGKTKARILLGRKVIATKEK